jgi:hypothetical protein
MADLLGCQHSVLRSKTSRLNGEQYSWGAASRPSRRDGRLSPVDMPTPVATCRHGLSVSSLRPPPSARVACGQGVRQDTTGAGYRAGASGGTELASASGVHIGPGHGRVRAPDRVTSPPTCVPIDADVPDFPIAADRGGSGC